MKKSLFSHRGFTLIELLVVIAIIAILAAILFPVFAQAKAAAKKASAVSNAKEIVLGAIMYANDYDDTTVSYYNIADIGGSYVSGSPYQYWPGLVSPYIQKAQNGLTGSGGEQALAQDLSKVFFDPIEAFTFPTTGAYGNIASWGISDDYVQYIQPYWSSGYLGPAVNFSAVQNISGAVYFAETWDYLNCAAPYHSPSAPDPGYPGSALALSIFDKNGNGIGTSHAYNPDLDVIPAGQPGAGLPKNGAVDTLQATYNGSYKVTWNGSGYLYSGSSANTGFTPADPKGQNVVGFGDGHVKSMNVGYLDTTPAAWSISGTGQWP